jgi:adenosylhomocysteine nucleosidase
MKVAIFSAFPQELKHIMKNVKLGKSLKRDASHIFYAQYSSHEIILVETGIGPQNAESPFGYVFETDIPDLLVSAGFGGALYEGAAAGDLVWASKVLLLSENSLAVLELQDPMKISLKLPGRTNILDGSVVTLSSRVKKSDIKKILPQNLSHPVCDMETYPLAKLSVEKGLPFLAVRSITDTLNEEIPAEFFDVTDGSGHYRFSRALGILLSNPSLIPQSIKLGRNSETASKNLWLAIQSLIETL